MSAAQLNDNSWMGNDEKINLLKSKVLILENDQSALQSLKKFFSTTGLLGVRTNSENLSAVLAANLDLGAILISENYAVPGKSNIDIATDFRRIRPELPIFIKVKADDSQQEKNVELLKLVPGIYTFDNENKLSELFETYLFNRYYPNQFVEGIKDITLDALGTSFRNREISCDAPYLVKDKIIYGELFSLMPLESNWCRGYIMMQADEKSIVDILNAGQTQLKPVEANFRDVNSVLGELTNIVWGGFKKQFYLENDEVESNAYRIEVPIIVNHGRKYISFGSDDPQLCFKYTLTDNDHKLSPLVIYQKFVFSLEWTPEKFSDNQKIMNDLIDSGELELF